MTIRLWEIGHWRLDVGMLWHGKAWHGKDGMGWDSILLSIDRTNERYKPSASTRTHLKYLPKT